MIAIWHLLKYFEWQIATQFNFCVNVANILTIWVKCMLHWYRFWSALKGKCHCVVSTVIPLYADPTEFVVDDAITIARWIDYVHYWSDVSSQEDTVSTQNDNNIILELNVIASIDSNCHTFGEYVTNVNTFRMWLTSQMFFSHFGRIVIKFAHVLINV